MIQSPKFVANNSPFIMLPLGPWLPHDNPFNLSVKPPRKMHRRELTHLELEKYIYHFASRQQCVNNGCFSSDLTQDSQYHIFIIFFIIRTLEVYFFTA